MSDIESNCFENILNRDELTATEQRKNHGATEQQNMSMRTETKGKDNLMKPKSWSHRSKDNDAKQLQTKNNTSGNFLMSLLLMQINIWRNSSKTHT